MQEEEKLFIGRLRSVAVHLIKHDRSLYQKITPIPEAADKGDWKDMSTGDKRQAVDMLVGHLPELEAYYQDYPHKWSKERFQEFKQALEDYLPELKA